MGTGINIYERQYISRSPFTPKKYPETEITVGIRNENGDRIEETPHITHGESYSFCIDFISENDNALYLLVLEDYRQVEFTTDKTTKKKYTHTIHLKKNQKKRVNVTFTPSKRGKIMIEPIMIDVYTCPYDSATNMAYHAGRMMTISAFPVEVE